MEPVYDRCKQKDAKVIRELSQKRRQFCAQTQIVGQMER